MVAAEVADVVNVSSSAAIVAWSTVRCKMLRRAAQQRLPAVAAAVAGEVVAAAAGEAAAAAAAAAAEVAVVPPAGAAQRWTCPSATKRLCGPEPRTKRTRRRAQITTGRKVPTRSEELGLLERLPREHVMGIDSCCKVC